MERWRDEMTTVTRVKLKHERNKRREDGKGCEC